MTTATAKPDTLPPAVAEAETQNVGWFRAMRTPEALELIQADPLAYVLAAIIAHRGRYNVAFNAHNLGLGEALLGDYRSYGMTRQQYRTAIKHLTEWHFATFKSTNKGTVGKLIDSRLFSIFRFASNQQDNHRPTNSQPTANQRLTTNEERKNDKNDERAKDLIEQPVRHEGGANAGDGLASLVRKAVATPPNADWHAKTLNQKLLQILGSNEIGKRPDWLRRMQADPEGMEDILDKMNADIREGNVIRNRGAYAEQLWKLSRTCQ